MPDSPTRRSLWPLSGAVYALLFGAGSAATLVDSPTFGGPSADALRYFTEHDTLIYAANIVSVLSVPFLLWFAAAIHTALDAPDHTSRIFAKAAAAGATAAAAATAVEVMILTVGVIRLRESNDLTAEQASLLYDISTAIGGVAIPCCLATTHAAVAFAIVTKTTPVLPPLRVAHPWNRRSKHDHPPQHQPAVSPRWPCLPSSQPSSPDWPDPYPGHANRASRIARSSGDTTHPQTALLESGLCRAAQPPGLAR